MGFTYKGYGRIYTEGKNVRLLLSLLRQSDEFEFDNYYPESLVAPIEEYPAVVYIGKFELTQAQVEELEALCPLFVFDAGKDECPEGFSRVLSQSQVTSKFLTQ